MNRNKTPFCLVLDIVLALTFVFAMEYRFTGIQVHAALGLFFGGAFLVHAALHWSWIVTTVQKLGRRKKTSPSQR